MKTEKCCYALELIIIKIEHSSLIAQIDWTLKFGISLQWIVLVLFAEISSQRMTSAANMDLLEARQKSHQAQKRMDRERESLGLGGIYL